MSQLEQATSAVRRAHGADAGLMLDDGYWYVVSTQPPHKRRTHGFSTLTSLVAALGVRAKKRADA